MKFTFTYFIFFLLAVLFSSCKKQELSKTSVHSVAEWIKVVPDLDPMNTPVFPQVPMVAALDGGMFVCFFDTKYEAYVIKINSKGSLEWKTDLHQVAYNIYASLLKDGSLIVFGDKGLTVGFSSKISPEGIITSTSEFSISNPFNASDVLVQPRDIYENGDGSIMVTGSLLGPQAYAVGNDNYIQVIFVCKLSAGLNYISSNAFAFHLPTPTGEINLFDPSGIVLVPGNRYLINGTAFNRHKNTDSSYYFIFTCHIDEEGNRLDSTYYQTGAEKDADNHYSFGYRATMGHLYPLDGNSFITWVSPFNYDNALNSYGTDRRHRIITFNAEGNITDSVFYSTPPISNILFGARKQNGDGFILLSGALNIPTTIPTQQIGKSVNVTNDGNVLQVKEPQQFLNLAFVSCCLLEDGHYAIAGLMLQSGDSSWQLCIIKTDENGYY